MTTIGHLHRVQHNKNLGGANLVMVWRGEDTVITSTVTVVHFDLTGGVPRSDPEPHAPFFATDHRALLAQAVSGALLILRVQNDAITVELRFAVAVQEVARPGFALAEPPGLSQRLWREVWGQAVSCMLTRNLGQA